jgi:16S rRNA A1518/A1519 N6-dimethyltransferase RsmA/KsgA/DIM1 with predicted DNA glycosylase/AP lyase activity
VSPGGTVRVVELGADMVRRLEWSLLDGPDRPGPDRHHGAFGEGGAGRAAINFSHGYVRREAVHCGATLELICGSALDENLPLCLASVDAIVGNLPYSISSPFLKRLALLDGPSEAVADGEGEGAAVMSVPRAKWRTCAFLVQDEFAHKAAARPPSQEAAAPAAQAVEGRRHKQSPTHGGGGSYGHLAVLLRAVCAVDLVGALVLPAAFNPPPAVNSRVLRLVRREDDLDLGLPAPQPGAAPETTAAAVAPLYARFDGGGGGERGQGGGVAPGVAQQWLAFVRLCWAAKRKAVKANLTNKGVVRRLGSEGVEGSASSQKGALLAVLDSARFAAVCAQRAVEVEPEAYRHLFAALRAAGVVFPGTSTPRDAAAKAQRREQEEPGY